MTLALGIRGKLVLLALALTALVLVPGGLFLELELRAEIAARIDAELEAHAVAARVAIERADDGELPTIAAALARETSRRVTIVGRGGEVLADSEVAPAALAAVANHGDRPEVVAARAAGRGVAERRSDTVDTPLRYLALALPDGRVVRVAQSLREIDAAVGRQRVVVALAGLIALGVAVAVSTVTSQVMAGSLRELLASTRTLAGRGAAEPVGGAPARPTEELERTIKLLAEERERFKAVLESMNDAVVALDPEHAIALMNPAARELLGAGDEALGRSLFEIVRVPALQDLLAATDGPRTAEFDLPGGAHRVMAAATPERGGGGVVLVLHDVTTVRRLETVRRDFVANVSHELRTPISIVSANAETLLRGALEDREGAPALVEAIFRNAARLRHMVDDLLDLSRLEAGRHEMTVAPVGLAPAAGRAIEAVAAKAEGRGTELRSEVPAELVALADRDALHGVLVNLLDNAIKYAHEGGRVVVGGRRDGDRVRLEVKDDGPGVAPAHRERIFERFYRIDPGRSRDMGGTGLGLAIVKHTLEAMDGRIGVLANYPRGSIFWFDLPAAAA